MMKTLNNAPIENCKNIGATMARRLNEIGIYNLADLAEATPAGAYKKLSKKKPNQHLPYCYYLYSLQGALLDVHWDELPDETKSKLRTEVEG